MNKKELRKYAINLRKNLYYDKNQLEKDVLDIIGDKKNIAIYYPLEFEIDLLFLKKYDLNLCFPKTDGTNLKFFLNPTQFKKGNFNVLEPIDGTLISSNDIDLKHHLEAGKILDVGAVYGSNKVKVEASMGIVNNHKYKDPKSLVKFAKMAVELTKGKQKRYSFYE